MNLPAPFNQDVYTTIIVEELRNHFEIPQKYQLTDFFGAIIGGYFLYDGIMENKWLNISLGALMVYTHTIKFFYAPKIVYETRRKL